MPLPGMCKSGDGRRNPGALAAALAYLESPASPAPNPASWLFARHSGESLFTLRVIMITKSSSDNVLGW